MTRMALRGLFARKLRTALTGFAVVIGVAFVAGTFIFTDTINASFDQLFKQVSKGVDVDITAKQHVEGHRADRVGEVTMDQATADNEGFEVGDRVRIAGRAPAKEYELVGITKLGDQSSLGIKSMSMPLSEVQHINATPGQLSEIAVAADEGTSPAQLKASISRALGGSAEVRTGEEQADKASADITDSLGFLTVALLVFAGIAVFVGGFLIFNTFAVTVAQRSREFALLRTLGASRRQVLNSVVVETLVIGFVASVIGILGGLVIAPGLRALLGSVGIDLPSTGTVIEPRTIIVALAVGMIATLVSGLVPARRAAQVQPVEAMREAGTPGAKKVSRRRLISSFAVIAVGLVALVFGLFGAEGSAAASLLGLGVVVMMLGVALLAPVLVRPLARFIGAPLERLQGIPGRLARENAERQPQRTAITASALMIGLALVVFTAIFAAGLSGSVDKVVDEQLSRSALIVTHEDGFSPVSPDVAKQLQGVPGVDVVSPMRFDQANIKGGGDSQNASGIDPRTITSVFTPAVAKGPADAFGTLRDDQVLADDGWADSHGFKLGDKIQVTTPKGTKVDYELAGTYKNQVGVLGSIVVTNASMTKDWDQPDDAFILVSGQGSPATLERAATS